MKTRKTILTVIAIAFAVGALVLTTGCSKKEKAEKKEGETKFVIGFSQCTTTEPWRVLFNKKLKEEAEEHPEVELIIQDAQDKTENQVAHLESFIAKEVDAILVSPKVSSGFSRVMKKAEEKGIPIIVLDRDLEPQNYTSFVGADNRVIGEAAGRYVVDLLGGPGEAKGKVYEIWGGKGSEPAHDRHNGFHKIVDEEPGIEVTGDQDCDWKQDLAKKLFETVLQRHQDIDIVYAHNDPMAYGAHLAAKEAGLEGKIKFIGIDGNPDEGAVWVKEGKLAATFLYPTPGGDGLLTALRVLNGIDVEKKITLPTAVITPDNADKFIE